MPKKKSKRKYWTPEEERRFVKLCEKDSQTEIARKMKRSVASVKGKRIRMNIESFSEQTDMLRISQVVQITGLQFNTITRTWKKYGFLIKKQGQFAIVTENELITFMQVHPELWKASDCDYYFFQRFDWFVQKLEREKNGTEKISHYRNIKRWTDLDISRFKMLKSRGLTHKEIAAELGRSRQSIDHISMKMKNLNTV